MKKNIFLMLIVVFLLQLAFGGNAFSEQKTDSAPNIENDEASLYTPTETDIKKDKIDKRNMETMKKMRKADVVADFPEEGDNQPK